MPYLPASATEWSFELEFNRGFLFGIILGVDVVDGDDAMAAGAERFSAGLTAVTVSFNVVVVEIVGDLTGSTTVVGCFLAIEAEATLLAGMAGRVTGIKPPLQLPPRVTFVASGRNWPNSLKFNSL